MGQGQSYLNTDSRILLSSAKVQSGRDQKEILLTLLRQGADWKDLVRLAEHHRLLPTVYRALASLPAGEVPADVLEGFKRLYDQNSRRNLFLTQELLKILTLFRTEGIPAIPLKGPVLTASLYGNLAFRHIYDLDILLQKGDIKRAKDLLIVKGYIPENPSISVKEDELSSSDWEYNLNKNDGQIHLELQWQVLPDFSAENWLTKEIWEKSGSFLLAGKEVRNLPPETLLCFLCAHGGDKHQWSRMKWICDVAQLLTVHRDLNWDEVFLAAERMNRRSALFLGIYLAEILLESPVPPYFSKKIRSLSLVPDLAGLVQGRLFREGFGLPGFYEWHWYVSRHRRSDGKGCSTVPRIRDFFSYLRAVMTPEWADQRALALPTGLAFVHYLSRPIRLFKKHRGRVLDRLK